MQIGYMPQQQDLYPDMTVAKFLTHMAVLKGVLRFKYKRGGQQGVGSH